MWIGRLAILNAAAGFLSIAFVNVASTEARAQDADVKECATQYQAAKAENKLAGQPWQDFFAACKAKLGGAPAAKTEAPAAAAPKAEAEAPKTEAATPPVTPPESPETHAEPAKQDKAAFEKKCHSEWKAKEAALKKKDPKLTWEKYLKQCGAHLKN
jgi:hypothetical protein